MTKEPGAEEYLNQLPLWAKQKNSLTDIRIFLEHLGNPDGGMKIIHVAGTNGKGSVCAFLTSMITEGGYHTGTFTSPHLIHARERIMLDGVIVDEQLFERAFQTIRSLAEKMCGLGYCHPTYFEFLFYMAMLIFSEQNLDYVILETGLGGRLDTTNVIQNPLITVITSVSLDHMEFLGHSIRQIAGEKAGIIKEGVPLIYDNNCKEASEVMEAKAKLCKSVTYPVKQIDYTVTAYGIDSIEADIYRLDKKTLSLMVPSSAEYQVMNALIAVRTLEVLEKQISGLKDFGTFSREAIQKGIRKMYWPGRMEQVLPGVYLDGAHNTGGISAFSKAAAKLQLKTGKKAWLMFSAVSGKDYKKMIQELCLSLKLVGVYVVHMSTEREFDSSEIVKEFQFNHCGKVEVIKLEQALDCMFSLKNTNELIFCVGSLYLIGDIKSALRRKIHD